MPRGRRSSTMGRRNGAVGNRHNSSQTFFAASTHKTAAILLKRHRTAYSHWTPASSNAPRDAGASDSRAANVCAGWRTRRRWPRWAPARSGAGTHAAGSSRNLGHARRKRRRRRMRRRRRHDSSMRPHLLGRSFRRSCCRNGHARSARYRRPLGCRHRHRASLIHVRRSGVSGMRRTDGRACTAGGRERQTTRRRLRSRSLWRRRHRCNCYRCRRHCCAEDGHSGGWILLADPGVRGTRMPW